MRKTLITINITAIVTFLLTVSIFFLMNKGQAEIVVGDANGMNPGVIEAYSGSTAPTGYLLCNGQAVSRTTYANLFKIIGTTYGVGDGSTTFNVPNLNGRIPVGKDSSTFTTLGATGGSSTTTLTTSNLPAHTHTVTAKGTVSSKFTGSSVTTSSNGTHSHNSTAKSSAISGHFGVVTPGNHCNYASGAFYCETIETNTSNAVSHYNTTATIYGYGFSATPTITMTNASAGAHTHTVTAKGSVASTFTGSSATTSSVGSGSSFTNLQPYIVVNYIIKY